MRLADILLGQRDQGLQVIDANDEAARDDHEGHGCREVPAAAAHVERPAARAELVGEEAERRGVHVRGADGRRVADALRSIQVREAVRGHELCSVDGPHGLQRGAPQACGAR
eukprot:CAMPEP_0170338864 /NCGR_PEP_ID=MMETSP0116_2-20130129/70482_1 /TAXON_ID=400756 /ORGANISM="Durinskia baltica, Strain CSIRO CS-38" /LENGTH=111 /DNA_ID=CAMNT_0010592267 /DNA_START=507 /DNA_END=842 /DNA_ORIENTATION=-